MSTTVVPSKGKITIKTEVSKRVAPRPKGAWKIPKTLSDSGSYLVLAIETVLQTGRKGIRITSVNPLPGPADTQWKLFYVAYQGSAPATLNYVAINTFTGSLNMLIDQPMPAATNKFYLKSDTLTLPVSNITTPDDDNWTAINNIFNDDVLAKSEKPELIRIYDSILKEQTSMDSAAILWGITTEKTNYDNAISTLTSSLTALSPAWNNLTADTPLGTGGGAAMRTRFSNVASTKALLQIQIDTLAKSNMDDIGSDGVLTPGEKLAVIGRFNNAIADKNALISKAKALNVGYTDFSNAFSALEGYLTGLSPAYNDTTQKTEIVPSVWTATWNTFDVARAKLATSLQGTTRTLAAAVTANVTITSTSQTAFDGYTVIDNDALLLAGQTTTTENGIYSVAVSTSAGASRCFPSSGTNSGAGSYTNNPYAYDNNASTYAVLDTNTYSGTTSVIYSGWTGINTAGTLTVNVYATCVDDNELGLGTGNIYYSTTGGSDWVQFSSGYFGSSSQGARTVTVSLTGIDQTNLRVRVDAVATRRTIKTWDGDSWIFTIYTGQSSFQIKEVYFEASAIGSGAVTLTKLADVSDGETYLVSNGSTYAGKSVTVNRPSPTGAITLTAADPPYQMKLPAYSAAPAKVLQNSSGALSWVDPSGAGSTAYDVSTSVSGRPTASQKVLIFVATRAFTVSATGHKGKVYTNPTATANFDCAKNGTSFGTMSFSTGGTFSISGFSSTAFAIGDVLTITAPSSQDSTMADVGLVLLGTC